MSFTYQAGSWTHPRKVVARLECSLQPDTGETITTKGMRQEVDIRHVVTSLKGPAEHLYVYGKNDFFSSLLDHGPSFVYCS